MKKTILITLCCASLMLITPLTGVAHENTVSSNLPEQPDDVEGLVAQIRTVVNEILQKYGYNPTVTNLCKNILNILDTSIFGLLLLTVCILSLLIIIPILTLFLVLMVIFPSSAPDIFIWMLLIVDPWETICVGFKSAKLRLPFQSIYTMLETKDNINTFDGCPCLQED